MHRPIFGHSFAVLVAPILLSVLAFYFLNKRKANARGDAEDADAGASGSMTTVTEMRRPNERKANVLGNAEDAYTGASGSMTSVTEMHRPNERKANVLGNAEDANIGVSSPVTGNCYEVFLSFRGSDTRNGFTDHLYHGLLAAGIHVFKDDDRLPYGKKIGPELEAAITNSQILIPILSVTYGESSWCLNELVQIMERQNHNRQMALPIFYKVKPAEVRHQTGKFGDTFRERETRLLKRSSFDPTILEKWKKALNEVSDLKGKEANGSEAELVKSIVQEVLRELKKKFELVITKNLVGIDSHVNKIMEFVDKQSHGPVFVGIHGMGGIGKTTLAKTIYNKLSNQFEHRSFIADIRESSKNGIHHLQDHLINDILKQKNGIHNQDEGINFISSKFKDKKILVLLDDVDDVIQVKSMVGNHDWFSSESKIIITSRNKKILEAAVVDYYYDLKEIDQNQSLILFSKHAFRNDSPPSEFEDLTREVVSTTGGLPLSLEVLGSLLCGQELSFWKGTIEKLKKRPRKEVQATLMISYEELDLEQRQIFLDIACFFSGTDRRIVSYMWNACDFVPDEGIEVLRFMSLIKIENDHELRMHDQLRDLGREIVREENQSKPQNRSRLWDFKEAQKVLKGSKGTNMIEAIDLGKDDWKDRLKKGEERYIYTEEQFKNLTNLRFLRMNSTHLYGDFKNLMEELKWLHWKDCPKNFEVTNFPVKELVILELQRSAITNKWEGWRYFMMAEKLKFLDLSFCEHLENADFLSAFKNLEVLILKDCMRLQRIDCMVEKLKFLDLSRCYSLTNTGFLSALRNLEVLILYHCLNLNRIDSSIGDMKSLRRLDLRKCHSLSELPAGIGELKALKQLLLEDARALSTLPDSITSLENLEVLDLSDSGIEELPKDIGMLRKLRELYVADCCDMEREWWENKGSGYFTARLELQSLPDLPPGLTHLHITCRSRKLPSFSHLVHLKQLRFCGCESVECIELPSALSKTSECSQLTDVEESELPQSLNTPFNLETLDIIGCGSIKKLDVSKYMSLRALHIVYCGNLPEVRGIDKLIYLETLVVIGCNIKQLDLPESKNLTYLLVQDCLHLVEIQGIDGLEFLTNLHIRNCTSLKRFLLPESKSLKYLELRDCLNIEEIHGIDKLEFLESLTIGQLTSMKRLLLPNSHRLKKLVCRCCERLTEIQGLDDLKFLEHLDIFNCTAIERVFLPESRNLKKLDAYGCNKLAEIQGLDRLEFLEVLDISETLVQSLELPELGRLQRLFVEGCENLAEIQGLDRLEFLTILGIFGCKSLKTIPRLSKTRICPEKLDGWARIYGRRLGE